MTFSHPHNHFGVLQRERTSGRKRREKLQTKNKLLVWCHPGIEKTQKSDLSQNSDNTKQNI